MKFLLTVSAVALLSCNMAADVAAKKSQDPPKTPARQEAGSAEKAAQAGASELPKPAPEMKKLAHMVVGRWQVEEKYEVTPLTPQGGEGKGTQVAHRGPSGLSIITSYNSAGTMGEVHGEGILTWSPVESVFKQFWVDNGTPGGELWLGKWEGESVVFTAKEKMGDKDVFWKQTFSNFSSDAYTLTFDMGASETDVKRFMTLKFTRMARQSAGERRHGMGMHGRPSADGWNSPRADSTLR
jgi:hypothetical protein